MPRRPFLLVMKSLSGVYRRLPDVRSGDALSWDTVKTLWWHEVRYTG
jgi:hypothetical protein